MNEQLTIFNALALLPSPAPNLFVWSCVRPPPTSTTHLPASITYLHSPESSYHQATHPHPPEGIDVLLTHICPLPAFTGRRTATTNDQPSTAL